MSTVFIILYIVILNRVLIIFLYLHKNILCSLEVLSEAFLMTAQNMFFLDEWENILNKII